MRAQRFAVLLAVGAGLLAGSTSPALAVSAEVSNKVRSAKAGPGQLNATGKQDLGNGSTLHHYLQEVGGVPVLNAHTVVQSAADGDEAALLVDSSRSDIDDPGQARVSEGEAVQIARNATGAQVLRGRPTTTLVIQPGSEGGTLVWDVKLPATTPLADYRVVIDAKAGEVLAQENILQEATGKAKIFTPNPVVTKGGWKGLLDRGDKDYAALTNLRRSVSLPRLNNGQTCLKGRWVWARNRTNNVCAAGTDFRSLRRASDKFEAVMAYHHIDRTQGYLFTRLFGGLAFSNFENRGPGDYQQEVRANNLAADNSRYSPVTFRIELGTGGVDDGEDADVITHEYGHALQDDAIYLISGGSGSYGLSSNSARAMGEGFGDYVAAMMQRRYGSRQGSRAEWCVAEWDAVSYRSGTPKCLRRTDDSSTLGNQINQCGGVGDIHCVGQVWSSALYRLKGALRNDAAGRDIMDRNAMLYTYLLPTGTPSWSQASNAVRLADCVLYPNEAVSNNGVCDNGEAGIHDARIVNEFSSRGFFGS